MVRYKSASDTLPQDYVNSMPAAVSKQLPCFWDLAEVATTLTARGRKERCYSGGALPQGHGSRRLCARAVPVLSWCTEVERGRKANRPELAKALHLAKVTGATLLASRDSGVRFVAVDMPEVNDLTVGIMALVAQAEREAISRRTKESLAVAKARGVKLGYPNGAQSLRRAGKGGIALRAAVSANANQFAKDLSDVVEEFARLATPRCAQSPWNRPRAGSGRGEVEPGTCRT